MAQDFILNYAAEGATVRANGEDVTIAGLFLAAAPRDGQIRGTGPLAILTTEGDFLPGAKLDPLEFPQGYEDAPRPGTWIELSTPDGPEELRVLDLWGRKFADDPEIVPFLCGVRNPGSVFSSNLELVPLPYEPQNIRVLDPEESQRAQAELQAAFDKSYAEDLKNTFEEVTERGVPGAWSRIRHFTETQNSDFTELRERMRAANIDPVMRVRALQLPPSALAALDLTLPDAGKIGRYDLTSEDRNFTNGEMEAAIGYAGRERLAAMGQGQAPAPV